MPSAHKRRKLARQKRRNSQLYRFITRLFTFPLVLVLAVPIILVAGSTVVVAQNEENDAFCASCHTQPESTFFQRAQAGAAVDLASDHRSHSTKCIDCHSGSGLTGRMAAISLGAKNGLALLTRTDIQPAPLTIAIGDSNCLKCHPNTEAETDFDHHYHAFLLRWKAVDPTAANCVDCHTAHLTDGDSTQAFLNTQRTEAVCQHCHSVLGGGG